jgi:uncharacterized protein (DUF1501 family)
LAHAGGPYYLKEIGQMKIATLASRRRFLQKTLTTSAGLAIGSAVPGGWVQALAQEATAQGGGSNDRILVVIQLSGGNDGLNTVVPYQDEEYRKLRPKLALPDNEILKVNDALGLHPALAGIHRLLDAGRFSIVQGVGYENPNRSHFESMDIWHTCHRKEERKGEGWLGRMIAELPHSELGDSIGLHLGQEQQPLALACRGVQVPSVDSIEQFRLKVADDGLLKDQLMATPAAATGDDLLGFLQSSAESALSASTRLTEALKHADNAGDFPETPLGQKLSTVSRLIVAGLSTKVYYVTLDGFDTHSQQPLAHAGLLRQWSEALEAFVNRLEQAGQADRVLAMTFSEFGRRVAENASEGTDHGAAAPLFFSGAKLPTAVIGNHPSLHDLDDGDLKFSTDFRRVYATVLEKWFQTPSLNILGSEFPALDII